VRRLSCVQGGRTEAEGVRQVLDSLLRLFNVGHGTLTIHASGGSFTRLEVNESAKPDELAPLLDRRSRP
jgi:hypothetical protein